MFDIVNGGIATNAVFDKSIGQDALDAGERYDSSRKHKAFDDGRRFRQNRFEIQRLELVAVEHPKFAEGTIGIVSEA
jgi:hypothetical protein